MRVEMNDTNRTIRAVDTSKEGQRDGVVTAESDDTGKGRAFNRRAFLMGICSWRP